MSEGSEIIHSKETGEINTDATLKAALARARKSGIKNIVLSSTRGEIGVKASRLFKGRNLIAVTRVYGFRE